MNLLIKLTTKAKFGLVAIKYMRLLTICLYVVASTLTPPLSFTSLKPGIIGFFYRIAVPHAKSFKHLISIFPLIDEDPSTILHNFHTKKIFYSPKIRHVKLLFHRVLEPFKHCYIIPCENKITTYTLTIRHFPFTDFVNKVCSLGHLSKPSLMK